MKYIKKMSIKRKTKKPLFRKYFIKSKLKINVKKDDKLYKFLKENKLHRYFKPIYQKNIIFEDFFETEEKLLLLNLQSIIKSKKDLKKLLFCIKTEDNKRKKNIDKTNHNKEKMDKITSFYLFEFENTYNIPKKVYIEYEEMKILEKFNNEGSFGYMYKVIINDVTYAAKKIYIKNDKHFKQIGNEIDILYHCHHKNIVTFLGYSIFNKDVFIITELCDDDNLRSVLRKKIRVLEPIDKINIIIQIYDGLCYLHNELQFAHRDLKSQNILLIKNTIKICDFGSGGYKNKINNSMTGSPHNTAPELIIDYNDDFNSIIDTERIDIYQFGLLMFEIWVAETPYSNFYKNKENTPYVMLRKVKSQELMIEESKLKYAPMNLRMLILKCCNHNFEKRPKKFSDLKTIFATIHKDIHKKRYTF